MGIGSSRVSSRSSCPRTAPFINTSSRVPFLVAVREPSRQMRPTNQPTNQPTDQPTKPTKPPTSDFGDPSLTRFQEFR